MDLCFQWTFGTLTTLFSLAIITQLFIYWTAFKSAPQEMAALLDSVNFAAEDTESYSRHLSTIQRPEDKLRLTRWLQEMQEMSKDFSEDMHRLESTAALRMRTRLLWASERARLDGRVRRLDLMRMRFMVAYLSIIMADREPPPPPPPPPPLPPILFATSAVSIAKAQARCPPARRLTTAGISTPKSAWAGVVEELQMSSRMLKRHESVEQAVKTTL